MKKTSKKVLFFGNEQLATGVTSNAPTLQALIRNSYDIAAIVTAQKPKASSRQVKNFAVEKIAADNKIPLISPDKLIQSLGELSSYKAEIAVLAAYGKLVPAEVINIFPKGIVNIHPSLLPLHRGPTPIESAILNNDARTGVSLMKLSTELDAGPIYAQESFTLSGNEIKQELSDKLANIGSNLIIQNLPSILDGTLQPWQQNESLATVDKQIEKNDGTIDWSKPAALLEREIRAFAGWPRSRTTLGATDVIITKARVKAGQGQPGNIWIENKQLGVYTTDGILIIDSLIPVGKSEMPAAAFLAGYKT